jgi:hypothetical protein
MRFARCLYWFLIAGMLSSQSKVMAQDLKVLVLDALNGKPQAGVQVHYICTGKIPPTSSKSVKPVFTNTEGLAEITNICSTEEEIELSIFPPEPKEQCGETDPFTFRELSSVGIVSKPDSDGGIRCPSEVSKKLKHVPGQVIVFVKKPTWWQSHVAGE